MTTNTHEMYTQKNFKANGNDWSIVFAPTYVSIRKETNNPFKGIGKQFNDIHEAIDSYKSIAMKAALMQFIETKKSN